MSALEALERNDISRLPGGIFSRAFVRAYAIEVGLDPEATIQEFIAQFPQDSVTAGHPVSSQSEDHEAIESERQAARTFVRLISLSVPIAAAMLYFGTAGRRAESPVALAPPALPAAVPERQAPIAGSVDAPEPAVGAVAPAPAIALTRADTRPSDRLTVGLSAVGECWVSATVDGGKEIERLLKPGERMEFVARVELLLKIGDASALAITLNGADARPLGRPGEVVTTRLNLMNFKDYVVAP